MELCWDCGMSPPAFGAGGLCQACEIAYIEDARFVDYLENVTATMLMSEGLGLSGDIEPVEAA